MHIVRYSYPGSRLGSGFESEIGRLFGFGGAPESGLLPVDLYEDQDNTYVRAELPGVKREDINVETADGLLTINASRKLRENGSEETVSLSRSVTLPERVDGEKIAASYENGVLTVKLPKPEQAKPRKISVEVK